MADGRLLRSLEGSGGALQWMTWHPRGDVVVAGTDDFMIYMWNAANGAVMQVFSGHCGIVSAGCFTPDGKSVVSVGGEDDASLRVWNPKTGECSLTIQVRAVGAARLQGGAAEAGWGRGTGGKEIRYRQLLRVRSLLWRPGLWRSGLRCPYVWDPALTAC